MAEILARLALKIDTYENWTNATLGADKGANLVLNRGEIGLCEILSGNSAATTAPTVLFKVGDGVTPFSGLKWASALAADVYSWAKAQTVQLAGENLVFKTGDTVIHTVDLSAFATDAAVTELLQSYYTKTAVDANIKVVADNLAAEITRATEAEAQALTDAKAYTDAEIEKVTTGSGYATTAYVDNAIDADVLVETNRATAAEGALGTRIDNVSAVAEAATTVSEVNAQIKSYVDALNLGNTYEAKGEAAKVASDLADYETANNAAVALKANAADVYTKTQADAAFMTQDEVDARVNKIITDAVDGDKLTSLTELVQYINTHGGEAKEMATAIENLEKMLNGFSVTTGSVKTYIDGAIAALNIGDYATATDLVELANRVAAIENAPYATTGNVSLAKSEAISTAKAYTDGEITNLNIGQYETINNVTSKIAAVLVEAQGYTDTKVAGLGIGNYLTKTDAANTYRAKADAIAPADMSTTEVFIFNCGSSTEVI